MNEEIIELYKQGIGLNRLASKFKKSNHTIREIVRSAGVLREPMKNLRGKKKYQVNEQFFSSIDTQEKAYILGFLYADGYVSTITNYFSITLSRRDINHLEKIKSCLNSNNPIHKTTGRYSNNHPITEKCNLTIVSSQMIKDLISIGCTSKKSLTLTFPTCISKDLIRHFIRGYFDGDGTVYVTKTGYLQAGFISTLEFCKDCLRHLNLSREYNIHKEQRSDKNVYYFTITGDRVEELYNYLYKDATIFLDRKKEKFDQFYLLRKPSTTIIRTPEMEMV